jgi:hypothetical protein
MNDSSKLELTIVFLLAAILVFGSNLPPARGWGGLGGFSFLRGSGAAHLVWFKGALYPPEEKKQTGSGHDTLKVLAGQKEWFFKVKDARDLSGDLAEFEIFKNIFPRILYLRGPDNLIGTLQKPEIIGKPVKIEGYLYIGDGILQLTSIENINQKKA